MQRIAIDLLWLRPGKVGGTESYIRNLLDGFLKLPEKFNFALLVSQDNKDTFVHYLADERFSFIEAPINSAGIASRIIWQNLYESRLLKQNGVRKCFVPVYCKPWFNFGVEYICVIHDLQAMHYPEYHPFHEVAYSRLCWRMDVINARKIIAISRFVRDDIISYYKRSDIKTIYNPILIERDNQADFPGLSQRYDINSKEYYYTIAQIIPHKNLDTLVEVVTRLIAAKNSDVVKLVITGVNGASAENFRKKIMQLGLERAIILTGFISNAERNSLYANCRMFLFPSVFEGFGMPPLEAMYMGVPVITTQCASIPEVTQDKAIYVRDPYDANEWINNIEYVEKQLTSEDSAFEWGKDVDYSYYDYVSISKQYLKEIYE